ncbi:AbrB/MazE/SpoVT family DNA-binding domain-containing protein [Oryzicola mucosus]|uniref:AbrB/MazE/SpoVT family DNA-binding domain-containing protein n=1 Tax=Oryzicola mucosus TaxID=2767425 RepID=A0A8J6TWM4_9HYPH|nr:AbrB/MazE/SpoVT family DNA-binding domain-containing protein [Oryzicola mucosus]MBD0413816.1 AbrB/MazE/SpoVT family DNA-binding domain-containing protein [Oryzicola mucosus]
MRVTEKGQVTIPKNIRDRLNIEPGMEVDFVQRSDGVVELVRVPGGRESVLHRSLEDWFAKLEGTSDSGLNSDEIMTLTRGGDGDAD